MNKKQSVVTLSIFLLFLFTTALIKAQEKAVPDDKSKSLSELGIVYKGMPKEYLENAGFTEYLLLDSKKKGSKEWLTFSDWTTPESGDTIIFIIEDGKVKDWMREGEKKETPWQDI